MLRILNRARLGVILITALTFALHSSVIAQIKVSCIGASVAAGYGVAPSEAYPAQVGLILGSGWNVGNFGESGSTLLRRADYPYVERTNYPLSLSFAPNIVTIELGSNDSKPYNWAFKADFINDYSKLIDTFRSLPSKPVIYVCLPIPAYTSNFDISNATISNEIIPLVRQIAALKNVRIIDLNTPLQNHPDWYQTDGIHPNATGARHIAEVVAATLAAPQALKVTVASKSQLNLSWTDRTNETGFTIQRSTDSLNWADIATVAANTTSYQDKNLTATTKYYYRISATISIGSSIYSDVSSATTAAGASIPVITSAGTATATAGAAFSYTITATNSPQSYNATGLPEGLAINRATGAITGQSLSSGVFNVTISATNADGTASKNLVLTVNIPAAQLPYNGTPFNIPGKIEAEEYDKGGQNIAYNDFDSTNNGGLFRLTEGVDIEACSEGGYDLGYTLAGEWAKYTINVTATGTYTLQARVAAPGTGGLFHVELDGVNISGAFVVPNTTGYQTWGTAEVVTPVLAAGKHVLRVIVDAGGFNFNYFNFIINKPVILHTDTIKGVAALPFVDTLKASFNPTSFGATGLPAGLTINTTTGIISGTPTQAGNYNVTLSAVNISGTGTKNVIFAIQGSTPFTGTPVSLPGKVEAENYDLGGQGIAYYDGTPGNNSGYRSNEDVDLDGCSEGGYNIGNISTPDEWTIYTVNITQAGTYTIQARVSTAITGTSFHIELNGQNISGTINIPNTGGWQSWQTVSVTTPTLSTGKQLLRMVMDGGGFNLNYVNFVRNGSSKSVLSNSILANEAAADVTIYPNPTNGSLTADVSEMKAKGKGSYVVYNKETGMRFTVPSYNNVLDVSSLPSGIYIISFNTHGKRVTKTFIRI